MFDMAGVPVVLYSALHANFSMPRRVVILCELEPKAPENPTSNSKRGVLIAR